MDGQFSDAGRRAVRKGILRGYPVEGTKMKIERPLHLAGITLVALAMLAAPVPSFSQSCALCYTQAASSGSRMIQALRSGILILIAPPTLMSIGLVFVCYRRRNQTRKTDDSDDLDNNPDDKGW